MDLELHGADRRRAAPLFEALQATDACILAGLTGEFGRLWVDRAQGPTVAHLHLDFHFLAGDPASPVAEQLVRDLPLPVAVLAPPEWEPLLLAVHADRVNGYTRTRFGGAAWDRDGLAGFTRSLPDGYRLHRVTAAEVDAFRAFDRDLVKNFRSGEHFLASGFGYAVSWDGAIVAGCSTFTIAKGEVEIEIDTDATHRRRGLALATGSALILHCLDHGLRPNWDAANEPSARLAVRLGFTRPQRYRAWYLKND